MHCFTKSWEQSCKRKTTVFLLEMTMRGFQWASYLPRDLKLVNDEAEFKSRSGWFQTLNSTTLLHYLWPDIPLHAASRKAWLLPSLHELLEARGTFWHAEGQLWHWNPTSANGMAFAHSKKRSSPWWESFQWLQLQNSHSSLTPDAHEGGFIVLYVKNEERARTSPSGKWWKIENYFQRHANWEVNSMGAGEGERWEENKQRSSWEVFAAPGRRGCDVHGRKPWLWISGHQDPVNTANPYGCWLNKPLVTKQCTVENVSASSRSICPHVTHFAGSVARTPHRGSTASISQLDMGWHSMVNKSTEFRKQDRIKKAVLFWCPGLQAD